MPYWSAIDVHRLFAISSPSMVEANRLTTMPESHPMPFPRTATSESINLSGQSHLSEQPPRWVASSPRTALLQRFLPFPSTRTACSYTVL